MCGLWRGHYQALLNYSTRPWVSENNLKNDDVNKMIGKVTLPIWITLKTIVKYHKLK